MSKTKTKTIRPAKKTTIKSVFERIDDQSLNWRSRGLPGPTLDSLIRVAREIAASLRPQKRLTMEEFSRTLKIAEGREKGRRFNPRHQPFQRLWFQEFDIGRTSGQYSPRWTRFATCGCVQSGKSLLCFDIPILYYLLECGERVIVGVPTGEQASQKWEYELKPMIEDSPYRWMLPKSGKGSRGGTEVSRVRFGNGAELIFMTGHGGDEKRSSTTSRIVIITEADKMDKTGTTSKEADPVRQIIARTESFREEDKVIILECTVSNTEGRIWKEYTEGSQGSLYSKCPHCLKWISPGRDQLVDWIEHDNVIDAGISARWVCPECKDDITDHRDFMIDNVRLAHRGQTLDEDGNQIGPIPKTETFGFRWNAFFNKFWTTNQIARKEWKASRSEDILEANREIMQFTWAVPEDPPELEVVPLDIESLRRKVSGPINGRGIVPPGTKWITMGWDIGKYEVWYIALAHPENGGTITVIEYGKERTHVKMQGEKAIPTALTNLFNMAERGFADANGTLYRPSMTFIDSRYETAKVREWVRMLPGSARLRYYPVMGFGETEFGTTKYGERKRKDKGVTHLGDRYHKVWSPAGAVHYFEIDVDYWKLRTHERLGSTPGIGGAIEFFYSPRYSEHSLLISHLTAEKYVEEFVEGKGREKGLKKAWVKERKANHLLDAIVYAQVAAYYCGYRVERSARIQPSKSSPVAVTNSTEKKESFQQSKPSTFISAGSGFLSLGGGKTFKLKGE